MLHTTLDNWQPVHRCGSNPASLYSMCAAHMNGTHEGSKPHARPGRAAARAGYPTGCTVQCVSKDTASRHRLGAARTHGGTIRTGTLQWMAQYELTEPRKNFCTAGAPQDCFD